MYLPKYTILLHEENSVGKKFKKNKEDQDKRKFILSGLL